MNTAARMDRIAEMLSKLTAAKVPAVVIAYAHFTGEEGPTTGPARFELGDLQLTNEQQAAVDQGAAIAVFERV